MAEKISPIIWQPEFIERYDFAVSLDSKAAIEFINAKIPAGHQKKMNELAVEAILKKVRCSQLEPYLFHKYSALITQVNIGGNGVWLAADGSIDRLLRGEKPSDNIKYHSHNVDSSRDALTLLKLFGLWASYYNLLRSKE